MAKGENTTLIINVIIIMNLLVLQCEDWTKEASQFLLQIGRKAADCKTSQDAVKLVQELDSFRNKGATEQNDRLSTMQQIIVELYGVLIDSD